MFTEYQEDIVREYQQKKESGDLPDNLKRVTTANLKAESADACANRYLRQDERTLARYFDMITDQQGYRDLIKDADPDDFKSVYQFLRGETKKPSEEIIELLAWLIDYQPRPYLRWVKERAEKAPIKEGNEREENEEVDKEPYRQVAEDDQGAVEISVLESKQGKKGITAVITIVVAITLVTVFIVWPHFKPVEYAPAKPAVMKKLNGQCMSWKEDHYEAVACNDGEGVPLDSNRLLHQRRILNPKTSITYASIGHVWYFRTPDSLEYFTAGGAYPLDTNRRLLPITRYMIDRHILPKHEQTIDPPGTSRSQ